MSAAYAGIQIPQPGTSLQRERRAFRIFTDQHGRRFGATVDKPTNAPIAEFQPQSERGFGIAPWYPSMFYAKFQTTGDMEFRWDYLALADEWSGGTASYYDEAVKLALQLPGDIPVPEVGGPIDRRIRSILGPPPLSPAIPLACELGDPWILGAMGAKVNEELKAILQGTAPSGREALAAIQARLQERATADAVALVPVSVQKPLEVERQRSITDVDDDVDAMDVTWPQFLAAAKARGRMTLPEIGVAWQEFKKDRAEGVAA